MTTMTNRVAMLPAAVVAEHYGVSLDTVRRWCRAGRMRAVRIGRTLRIPESELDRVEGLAGEPTPSQADPL